MDRPASSLMPDPITSLLFWRTLNSVSAFYMQRLQYERRYMYELPPALRIVKAVAHLMAWIGVGLAVYVWFKLGLGAAIAFLVIPFIASAALEVAEGRVFQSPSRASTLIGTPIALLSFAMLLRAVVSL
jgi:hypothetical protein